MTTVGDLLACEPWQWGLRGDRYLWRMMRLELLDVPLPMSQEPLIEIIKSKFTAVTGHDFESDVEVFFDERFSHGGMSSGQISMKFWQERGLARILALYDRCWAFKAIQLWSRIVTRLNETQPDWRDSLALWSVVDEPAADPSIAWLEPPVSAELESRGIDDAEPAQHIWRAVGAFGLVSFECWPDQRSGLSAPAASPSEIEATSASIQHLAKTLDEKESAISTGFWILSANLPMLTNEELSCFV